MYALWDLNGALSPFWPEGFPKVNTSEPLYTGIAEKGSATLAERMGSHLNQTRWSTVRRNLTLLLLDELPLGEGLTPVDGKKYYYTQSPAGEQALTAWMLSNLTATWVTLDQPGEHERAVIGELLPPLNADYAAHGPYKKPMFALRQSVWNQFV